MKKIIDTVFIMICLVFVAVPFLLMNRHEDVTSEIDNRKLVEMPVFGAEGYTDGIEQYLQDRIGFRRQMVNSYAAINDKAFHEMTHPSYEYGQDGYVFFKMHQNNPYGGYPRLFADMVKKMQVYCESRGSHFYFIFDPEKISVYRSHLPRGVNYDDSWVDEMFQYMDKLGINYVNNTQLLMDKAQKEQVFNKVYDAGHWNDLGMFYGTNALWKRIHEDIPAITSMSKSEFKITEVQETVLPVSEFKISEKVPRFQLKKKIGIESEQWFEEIELDPSFQAFTYEKNTSNLTHDLPRILMFQGSYYNRGARFIASRANTYIGIHNYQNVFNLPYYFNIFKPDVVVLDAAEYVFADAYFDSSKMKVMDFNPSLSLNNDSDSFNTQVEKIKRNANKLKSNMIAVLVSGNKIDKIILDQDDINAKYAYLLINNEVYDFTQDEKGKLKLSLTHGKVNYGDTGVILITGSKGSNSWASITISK